MFVQAFFTELRLTGEEPDPKKKSSSAATDDEEGDGPIVRLD